MLRSFLLHLLWISFETLYKRENPLVLKCGSFSEDLYAVRLTKNYSLLCFCSLIVSIERLGPGWTMLCLYSMSLDIPATNIALAASAVEEHETLQCWSVLNWVCKNCMCCKAYATNIEYTEGWLSAELKSDFQNGWSQICRVFCI